MASRRSSRVSRRTRRCTASWKRSPVDRSLRLTSISLPGQHVSARNSSHGEVERFYPLFQKLGVTPAHDIMDLPGGTEVLIAGVRRATNTPPMRGGKRVVHVSLDDGTGQVSNVVFFHDVQEQIGSGVFQTHYLLVRGTTRRSGARGVSVTGAAAWDLLQVSRDHERKGMPRAGLAALQHRAG